MKKFIHKIQDLSQKAAQLKQVVAAAPGHASQLADTVLMTAGQLQQLRTDVQSSVTGLRADSDDRLAQALREIHDHATVFEEAGYELVGVDMELSPIQRLIVRLQKFASVPEADLRALVSAHASRQTVHGLLSALAKADAISERVRLRHLTYREVVIHVGPTPCVRLCWGMDDDAAPAGSAPTSTPPPLASATTASPPPPLPAFASSNYFEQRPAATTPRPTPAPSVPEPVAVLPPPPTSPAVSATGSPYGHHAAPSGGSDWKKSALDRFKKMPDGSKYRR